MWRLQAAVLALAVVAAAAAAVVGPPVLAVFGPSYRLPAWFVGGLVLASGLLGCLCVGSALAMARSRHRAYLSGWALAAAGAVVLLVVPAGGLETRVVAALLVAPLLGLALQVRALRTVG
jgi:hypothetical protein